MEEDDDWNEYDKVGLKEIRKRLSNETHPQVKKSMQGWIEYKTERRNTMLTIASSIVIPVVIYIMTIIFK